MLPRRALLPLLAAALLLPFAGPARATLIAGVGDEKPDLFRDARFLALNVNHVRRTVAWDALDFPASRADLDRWMAAARIDAMHPLISFDHSWQAGRHALLPSAPHFRGEFARFHARYPWVVDYATWNEVNYCGESICHRPDLVAGYYRAMRSVCPACRVLAGELLDVGGMTDWVRRFRRYARLDPHYWGLHNYIGANTLSDSSTRALLHVTRGVVWLTETGGLVARRNRRHSRIVASAAQAARVTEYLFSHLPQVSRRVQRIYLYEWDARTSHDTWDSALIGPDGRPRPAYAAFARALVRLGVAPRCAFSRVPPTC